MAPPCLAAQVTFKQQLTGSHFNATVFYCILCAIAFHLLPSKSVCFIMVFALVTYIKNRQIGSTYPSINASPDSKTKKTLKKLRESLVQKCVRIMNSMPFIHPRPSTGLINIIELQGMLRIHQFFLFKSTNFGRRKFNIHANFFKHQSRYHLKNSKPSKTVSILMRSYCTFYCMIKFISSSF